MKPEFCEPNFCDLKMNPNFSLTLTPAANWYQMDKPLLYDHTSKDLLYTNGADDDSTSVYITLDMQGEDFIGDVKIVDTNVKTGAIEVSDDGITYTSLNSFTNTKSSYHWHSPYAETEYQYLATEDGELILTELGELITFDYHTLGRYVRITLTSTQIPNEEKYIGELYIGRRLIKVETSKVLNYSVKGDNPNEHQVRDIKGYRRKNRIDTRYSSKFSFSTPSQDEATFFKSLETVGGMYELFPDPDQGTDLDHNLSIDDVYLVQAAGVYNRTPYGTSGNGRYSIDVMETKYLA